MTAARARRLTAAAFLFALCAAPGGAGAANAPGEPAPAQNPSARAEQNSSARTAQNPAVSVAAQSPGAYSAADKDWAAQSSGPRAPGKLRLRGYTLRPAENREAEALRTAWDRIMQEHEQERFFTPHPNFDRQRLGQWRTLAGKMPGLSAEDALRHINGFFNGWPSKKDANTYGEEEHWATPEEFVRNNGGDCEDYAVVKYMALRHFGVPAENMWLLLAYDRGRKAHHAVLAVYAGERLFMLDNLSRPSYLLIPEAVFLKTFTPLVAVNEKGILLCTPENPEGGSRAGEDGRTAAGDRPRTAR
ncbi:MAG: transglutaminase-like cysteine peptidase [Desulfovibrio sp.]|nr:transglutaminase-like cysteine peptidase [Desulfovibrio sp.]